MEQYKEFKDVIIKKLYDYWKDYQVTCPEYKFAIDETERSFVYKKFGGYVYFIRNKYNGYIKIGSTKNLEKRLKDIKSVCRNYFGEDDAIEIIGLIDTSFIRPVEFEHFLHNQFRDYNIFGEWFDFPEDIWNEIHEKFFFDFEYDDAINIPDFEKFNLNKNQIHGIGYIGNPNDKDFMKFLYGRYDKKYSPTIRDMEELALQLFSDVYGIKSNVVFHRIFSDSFYNYAKHRHVEEIYNTLASAT